MMRKHQLDDAIGAVVVPACDLPAEPRLMIRRQRVGEPDTEDRLAAHGPPQATPVDGLDTRTVARAEAGHG